METKIINGHTYEKAQGGWSLVAPQVSEDAPKRKGAGEFLPSAFAVGGGILGGIAGVPLGPAGIVGGGIAGAGAGGALGEGVQQSIEKKFGQRKNISAGQIAGTGLVSAGTQAIGGVITKGVGMAGGAILEKTRKPMISFLTTLSGYNDEMIARALTRTSGVTTGLAGGEKALKDIVVRSSTKVNEMAKKSVAESKTELERLTKSKLSENSLFAKAMVSSAEKYKPARTEIFNKYGDFRKTITSNLRDNNIGVDKNGVLSFNRASQPSRIVAVSEQKAIQEAHDLVNSVRKNLSLRHVDSVFDRLVVLKSKTSTGTPTGTETKAVIGNMMDEMNAFTKKVFPKEYTNFLENNLQKRIFINDAKELLGETPKLSPKEQTIVMNRLLQLFNTGRLPQREFLEEAGKKLGEDIVGTSSGTLIKTGGQVSVRAENLTKRGLVEKVIEGLPRASLNAYLKTGNLTGDLLTKPIVVNTAKTLGISTKVLLQEIANLSTEKTTR